MRVLIFHGYLLRGTGSNVYNANLAAALVRLSHEVHLVCQERHPETLAFVDAVGAWTEGTLEVRGRREPVRCTVYRPEIGELLPVYVPDRYEGLEARPFPDLDERELDAYLDANVRAVAEVAARVAPDAALANHLVMGPVILARALGPAGVPYAVKVHGSALEYTVKPHPRFLPFAREGLAGARGVLVGSDHVARSLWAAIDDAGLPARTRVSAPGVDTEVFRPRDPDEARAALAGLAARVAHEAPSSDESAFARDARAASRALAELAAGLPGDRLVAYVGKLIVSKGVDLLLAAWPLVLARVPSARLAVVGFGAYRAALERLLAALAADDLEAARTLAAEGRAAEGGLRGELRHLSAFLDRLDGSGRSEYAAAAARLPERVVFTGRLEQEELGDVLPACEAQVVPSTFPEAFGMVAAEAAACGALPLSAEHSGLAEATAAIAASVPQAARGWLSFALGDRAVEDIAERLIGWLEAPPALREATRVALVADARRLYSWERVAADVLAAAAAPPPSAACAPAPGRKSII